MEFYSNTRKPVDKGEKHDNKMVPVYRKEIDKKTGEVRLVKDREYSIYDKIQEYAEETKLSNILARYNVNMMQNMKEAEDQFVDLTNLPNNLLEAMTTIDNAKYLWERQAPEFKAEFGNDFKRFVAGSENGEIMKVLTKHLNTPQEKFDTTKQANYVAPVVEPNSTNNNGGITTNV